MTGVIVLHGGLDHPAAEAHTRGLSAAADAAAGHLARSSLDAAVAAVAALESDEQFNAGRGAVLNADGDRELDACVIDGTAQRWAGITGLRDTLHPVRVAHRLLERGPTVLLAGDGATRFARDNGFPAMPPQSPDRPDQRGRARPREPARAGSDPVGCLAVDPAGRIAAASSSGGLRGKAPGRVGDAAVAGTGLYADTDTAVICAGSGEASLTATLALRAALLCTDRGAASAAESAIATATRLRAELGVVVYDHTRAILAVRHNASAFTVLLRTDGHDTFLDPARDCTQLYDVQRPALQE